MLKPVFLALAAALALGGSSLAQAPAPAFVRVAGVVTAASADSVSVKGDDGKVTVMPLVKTWTVVTTRTVDIESIKPGAFVATANTNIDDKTGKSIELRMLEPGVKLGEGSRPMNQPSTTMTNGTVQAVKKTASGHELDVSYPGGMRHIIVPSDVKVIGAFPAPREAVKAGVSVVAVGFKGEDGVTRGTRISIAAAK